METPHLPHLVYRKPLLHDGQAVYNLVKNCPPLELNCRYLYFLQTDHFADTCVLAELYNRVVGFISAYIRPYKAHTLFVWQVAVAAHMRGKNMAKKLLLTLIKNQDQRARLDTLSTTIGPSNTASQKLPRSFARSHCLEIRQEKFLAADQFGEDAREAELLNTFTAANNRTFIESIT